MAKLKPWYQVVTPREDLRDNRALDASEFAVNLGHIHDMRREVHADYREPDRFFDRTLLTSSLKDLSVQVLRRLNGISLESSAVFNMATQFGGGKTHSLTALYHLCRGGEEARHWKGIASLMTTAGVTKIPTAAVAVFNGKDFDSLNGRGGGDEPVRKTPWGDIAWQLGGAASFAVIAEHDREFIEPKGDAIRAFLPKDRPTLILMDEILSYASTYRGRGYGSKLYNFLDCVGEVARAEPNVVVVVSIPASELEYTAEDTADEARFKKMLDRIGKAIQMSADQEMAEIIRRRLFEWYGLPDDGKKTVKAYADWAAEHDELARLNRDSAYERFASCYPFHPSVISVFEGKWQSLRQFQRTRGVLRLLALWVAHNCQPSNWKYTEEPLITLGLAPFDNLYFRSALFEQLGDDKLGIPVTTDIWKKDGETHSGRLDKEATEAIRKAQLHRKVASTVFFESTGGMSPDKTEASVTEIKTDVCGPDINTTDVDTVLEGLASSCFYLQWERNRYRFGLSPNLNQVLVTRRGDVKEKAIVDRIREQTEKLVRKNGTEVCKYVEREPFPKSSNEVKEIPRITLAVMGIEHPAQERETLVLMNAIVKDSGTSGRTLKSALIFAAPDSGENLRDKAREVLAWEDIDDDEETKKRIDEGQQKLLARNLGNARRDLDEAIFRAYKHLYLLEKDNKLRHIDLGNITSSSATCLVDVYLQRLGSNGGLDLVVDSVPARKLPGFWPPSMVEWSTRGVRDAFYSSPLLPRLINPDAVKRAIADGVQQGIIGYAVKDASGRLKLEKLKESLFDAEVEISDDVFILKAEDAQKLREPPRLAQILVRPEHVTVKLGDQAAFTCSGVDQYGQPIAVGDVAWSATGGTIDANGLFTAGDHGGAFTVKATCGGSEALAEVRIATKDEPITPPPPPGARYLRWRGVVPAQKWMNFYTKVLSKFATSPDLKIEVSFETKVDREQADARAAETKTGLREVGLDDRVEAV